VPVPDGTSINPKSTALTSARTAHVVAFSPVWRMLIQHDLDAKPAKLREILGAGEGVPIATEHRYEDPLDHLTDT
jgi:hypothetical protein